MISFVWSRVGSSWIISLKANYAFLDELQDQWKLEISNCGFWIADCGFVRIRKVISIECGLRPLRAVGSLYEPEAIGA
jgi:hypothetical protein